MTLIPRAARPATLLPLFLVSAGSVGFETALTRYFAVAKWSEYGYWIISIAMAGLALSGVVVALARPWLVARQHAIRAILPVALIAAAALGYHAATANPFNPLQLQNPVTWLPQLGNIGLYYAALLPFFFLAGLYISLAFVLNDGRIGAIYAADLTGAGAGALTVLLLMQLLHPFALVPALLVPLALAALHPPRWRGPVMAAAALALLGGEALLLLDNRAAFNDFKAIYAPLHVPGSRVLATVRSPRGLYMRLDDFTERVDTDISNDSGLLNLPGPPTAFGLYRDGNRIAALPRPGPIDARYAPATLAALPYVLHPHAAVLLIGPSGGFRIAEALALGAASILALEPDPVLRDAERPVAADPRVTLSAASPLAATRAARGRYDIIDLSADFLDETEANAHAYTTEALRTDLDALSPTGILSIPVSIREFPAYAVRMLATVRAALARDGDPAARVIVYRSAWNVRILVRRTPWDAAAIAAARRFADDRSFDVSYYPGIDVAAARATLYNDLPAVSFERGQIASTGAGAHDAVADEAGAALAGRPTASQLSFNLAPITENRPFFYDVLRLNHLPLILRRIEILPQAEIAPLVNLAVLAQAATLAFAVLLVPALFPPPLEGEVRGGGATPPQAAQLPVPYLDQPPNPPRSPITRRLLPTATYFAALGLGFLFIEIVAIEKAAYLLNDRAGAFALVLTSMLIFSGLGSLLSAPRRDRAALAAAVTAIALWCALVALYADRAILAVAGLPYLARAALVILALAPVSIALGLPFPLGLRRIARQANSPMLPWAWALNGAFSVVATPLANLGALLFGLDRVLFAAILLYGLCYAAFPAAPPPRE